MFSKDKFKVLINMLFFGKIKRINSNKFSVIYFL